MSLNLSIKGVPENLAERLRTRAERNHRSLQGELMAIIERAAADVDLKHDGKHDIKRDVTHEAMRSAAELPRRPLVSHRQGHVSIEQIAAELLARYPQPFEGLPRAVDIIRKDRDSR